MKPKRTPKRAHLLLALFIVAGAAQAQGSGAPMPPLPRWEIGAFGAMVSQQAYPGSDQQVQRQIVLPYLVYRGEVLRADRDNAGLRALRSGAFELDVGVSGALGAGSSRIDARRGMADLGTLIEAGPRLRWTLSQSPDGSRWRLDLPLRAVLDLDEGLQRRGMTFEPELKWQGLLSGGWFVNTGISAIIGDQRLAQTYYGVARTEATALRPAFEAKSGLIAWRAAAAVGRRLGPDWNLVAYTRVDSVAGAANEASPLVRQQTGATVGVGLSYVWKRSTQAAVD